MSHSYTPVHARKREHNPAKIVAHKYVAAHKRYHYFVCHANLVIALAALALFPHELVLHYGIAIGVWTWDYIVLKFGE